MEDTLTPSTSFAADLGKTFVLSLAASAGTMAVLFAAGYTYSKYLEWKEAEPKKTPAK